MILLFTHSRDEYCVPLVERELHAKRVPFRTIHTDRFPLDFEIVLSFTQPSGIIIDDEFIALEDIRAVWIRKWVSPGIFNEGDLHPGVYGEADRVIRQFLQALLPETRILDSLQSAINGENKWLQLQKAIGAGLLIPETLITNHAWYVEQFTAGKDAVVKMQIPLSWSMQGGGEFLYTSSWNPQTQKMIEPLKGAPLTYQERIPKKEEYRIIYVDGEFHCGVIPGEVFHDRVDWRIPGTAFTWKKGSLPKPVREALKKFMHAMDLHFGAIDMIRTPDDQWYFLEVNPTGEWGMLEKELGLEVSVSIAKYLTK